MPLVRYEVRCEHSLANPELYRTAGQDDSEGLLEGVAMAGLVGLVRQLGDLAEFAAEIFHDLHDDIVSLVSRGGNLKARVTRLEGDLPAVEKALIAECSQFQFAYSARTKWRAPLPMDQNLCAQGELPRFVRNFYDDCRGPPRLFLLDKFDEAGRGACVKRYTDPTFFRISWAASLVMKAEQQRRDREAELLRKTTAAADNAGPKIFPRERLSSALFENLEGFTGDFTPELRSRRLDHVFEIPTEGVLTPDGPRSPEGSRSPEEPQSSEGSRSPEEPWSSEGPRSPVQRRLPQVAQGPVLAPLKISSKDSETGKRRVVTSVENISSDDESSDAEFYVDALTTMGSDDLDSEPGSWSRSRWEVDSNQSRFGLESEDDEPLNHSVLKAHVEGHRKTPPRTDDEVEQEQEEEEEEFTQRLGLVEVGTGFDTVREWEDSGGQSDETSGSVEESIELASVASVNADESGNCLAIVAVSVFQEEALPSDKLPDMSPDKLPDMSPDKPPDRPPDYLSDTLSDKFPYSPPEEPPHSLSIELPDRLLITLPDRLPNTRIDNLPSSPPERLPNTRIDSLPSSPPDRLPNTRIDNLPSSPPDRLPNTRIDSLPSSPPDSLPNILVDSLPSSPPSRLPNTRIDRLPNSPPNRLPNTLIESLPSSPPDRLPNTLIESLPSSPPDRLPNTLIESLPSSPPDRLLNTLDEVPEILSDKLPYQSPDAKLPLVPPSTPPAVLPDKSSETISDKMPNRLPDSKIPRLSPSKLPRGRSDKSSDKPSDKSPNKPPASKLPLPPTKRPLGRSDKLPDKLPGKLSEKPAAKPTPKPSPEKKSSYQSHDSVSLLDSFRPSVRVKPIVASIEARAQAVAVENTTVKPQVNINDELPPLKTSSSPVTTPTKGRRLWTKENATQIHTSILQLADMDQREDTNGAHSEGNSPEVDIASNSPPNFQERGSLLYRSHVSGVSHASHVSDEEGYSSSASSSPKGLPNFCALLSPSESPPRVAEGLMRPPPSHFVDRRSPRPPPVTPFLADSPSVSRSPSLNIKLAVPGAVSVRSFLPPLGSPGGSDPDKPKNVPATSPRRSGENGALQPEPSRIPFPTLPNPVPRPRTWVDRSESNVAATLRAIRQAAAVASDDDTGSECRSDC